MESELVTKNVGFLLRSRSTTSSRPRSSSFTLSPRESKPRPGVFTRFSLSASRPFVELHSKPTHNLPGKLVAGPGTDRVPSSSDGPRGRLVVVDDDDDDDKESLKWYSGIFREWPSRGGLSEGKLVHGGLIKCRLVPDSHLCVSLINFYAKCGDPASARKVLDKMPDPNIVLWTAVISGYVNEGCGSEGVALYSEMRKEDVKPDKFLVATVLKGCVICLDMELTKQVHAEAIKVGVFSDVFVGTALVSSYAKCGELDLACRALAGMPDTNVVSWTAVISGFVGEGYGREAAGFYCDMRKEDTRPDEISVATVLKGCSMCLDVELTKQVHTEAIKVGVFSDVGVGNTLISSYAKCGELDLACRVLAGMPDTNVVSWTAVTCGFVGEGYGREAAGFYCDMRKEDVRPNEMSVSAVLKCCSMCIDVDFAKQVHAQAIKVGVSSYLIVRNALIDIYTNCSEFHLATRVFAGMPGRNFLS